MLPFVDLGGNLGRSGIKDNESLSYRTSKKISTFSTKPSARNIVKELLEKRKKEY